MAGRGVWRCYSLLLLLAKCISGFGIEQSFTIYMDVGTDIENVIKWSNTCEAKQTNRKVFYKGQGEYSTCGFCNRLDSLAMDVVVRKIKKVHLHPKFSRFSRDNNYVDENRKLISGQILRRMVPYKRCKTLEDNHISPNQICTKIDTSLATDSGPETDENSVMDIRIASNGPLVLLAYDMNEKHHRLIAVDSESEQLNSSYTSHHITSVYDNLDFIENIVWKGE
ncbi:unnamed protein product [Ceratitis capitata]|uniref:(Mediterranean fruit fly) hypothetical protein n=1 Tax=Ceratitis capitata TaxID=7213 RepID=A0A811U961_CERCA|nr:unnamed protein product [Ceratitis capitata]